MNLIIAKEKLKKRWNNYVFSKKDGSIYHLFEWKNIIEKAYGHKSLYLAAIDKEKIVGILPLIITRSINLHKELVSIPFFDHAGIIADSIEVESFLINKAIELTCNLNAKALNIRQKYPLAIEKYFSKYINKVIMIKELKDDPESLMASFKSKLRSQIKRPLREGIYVKNGGKELFSDFYRVFSFNMKDLGSPVHSRDFIQAVLDFFPHYSRLFVAYYSKKPISCAFTLGVKETLENPWASSLRYYNRYSPNMLLYWKMLEYACKQGYKYFNFGRSSYGSGTYRFKKQWETKVQHLYWYKYPPDKSVIQKEKYTYFIKIWKNLPLSVANLIGPYIRRYIDL